MVNNKLIVRADKDFRKKTIIAGVLALILFVFLIIKFNAHADYVLSLEDTEAAMAGVKKMMIMIMVFNLFITGAFSIFFFGVASKTFKQRRFPPEGMRVLKDTVVVSGDDSKKFGKLMVVVGVLVLSTNGIMALMLVIFENL